MKLKTLAAASMGAAALVAVWAAACRGTQILNTTSSNDVYELSADIVYGENPRQRLDVYRPSSSGAQPAPVIVFFYGGGWREGDRGMYEFVASSITREGYVVVIPDYRLFPEVQFPAFIEDAAEAVAWVQRSIAGHGGDPDRIFLAGHSAGSHLAAMVALDPSYLKKAGGDAGRLVGFVGLSGPYDFLPLDEGSYLQELFPAATRDASQPVNHVRDSGEPPLPMLLVHGTDDERVWPKNSRNLAAAAREAGGDVKLKLYEGVGHKRVAAALAPLLEFTADTRADILDWLARR
ncbi:alpha/beta hydrolase [Saltatorellus ferox]